MTNSTPDMTGAPTGRGDWLDLRAPAESGSPADADAPRRSGPPNVPGSVAALDSAATLEAVEAIGSLAEYGSERDSGSPDELVSPDHSDRRFTTDTDGRLLRELRRLVDSGAPEADLIVGVKRARAVGWSWTPIAIVLDVSRDEVLRRFSRGIGHPCARKRRCA